MMCTSQLCPKTVGEKSVRRMDDQTLTVNGLDCSRFPIIFTVTLVRKGTLDLRI
jgi:hypothetical protein